MCGSARVSMCGGARVSMCDSARVSMCGCARVSMCGCARVSMCDCARVKHVWQCRVRVSMGGIGELLPSLCRRLLIQRSCACRTAA